jgi:glycosyltransferase involved in cell wall biosynthesis
VGVGEWIAQGGFERVAVRYNLPQHERVCQLVAYLGQATGLQPEVLYASDLLGDSVGLPGQFEPSLIPLEPFLRVPVQRPAGRPFTVGRASRDVLEKHHPADMALYRLLAAQGVQVRIMGGTCLAPWLGGLPNIDLVPTGSVPIWDFYAGLDALVYRTGTFFEPYGRVVFEAMASGLPVVVSAQGGFSERVDEGVSGFLYNDIEEAFDAIARLRADDALRLRMGEAAREVALALHGPQAVEAMLAFYERQSPPISSAGSRWRR